MKIPIIFLGTGQAIPTLKRNHTSIYLRYKQENLLIDCGEGTQRQMRKANLNPCKINRILITHWHGDHVLGLPGLFQTLALSGYNREMHVYGPKGTKKYMKNFVEIFSPVNKFEAKVHEIDSGKVFETPEFYVEALPQKHGTPSLAYSFIEKDKLRINKEKIKKLGITGKKVGELAKGKDIEFKGKKIKSKDITYKQEGRKITIILDTAMNPNAITLAKDSDLLITESTFLASSENGENLAKEYKHLTAKQAGTIAKKSKSKKLIITHISQRYEKNMKKVLKEAKSVFPNTQLVKDLDKIEL